MVQDPFKYFRVEAHELVDELGKGVLELERGSAGVVPKLPRLAHTLKGAARVVRRPDIAEYAHAIEDALAPYRESAETMPRQNIDAVLGLLDRIAGGLATLTSAEEADSGAAAAPSGEPAPNIDGFRTVFAEVGELDGLLEGVAETRTQLRALRRVAESTGRARVLAEQLADQIALRRERDTRGDKILGIAEELRLIVRGLDRGLASANERMERELSQVHDAAEQLRLVPAGTLFAFLERAARDVAHALGKLVTFEGKGGDVRLDSHVLRVMHEALLQIVRNAVAHGIESETDRRLAGKPAAGHVTLEISRRGRRVVFRCRDDGRGIDLDGIRRAAVRRGMRHGEAQVLGAAELVQVLLKGGISTAADLTEVSGRGVGMDVVRAAITRLGGELTAETVPGKGATFELVVPLTLAAAEALIIDCGGLTVGIPFDAVRYVVHTAGREVYRTARGEELVHAGRAMPFVRLSQLLGTPGPAESLRAAVVISGGGRFAAIGVEGLKGTASVVFRSLPPSTPAAAIVAGASLDADGNPQLMLDPDSLVLEAERQGASPALAKARPRPILVIDDSLTTRMLEQSILESAGYDVDLATSAEEALEVARRKPYSLFLVDVEMPGMDGFAFIQRIRADTALRDTPAILVTSRNEPEDLQRGKDVGAQGYVIKSEFNQANLLARIRELAT